MFSKKTLRYSLRALCPLTLVLCLGLTACGGKGRSALDKAGAYSGPPCQDVLTFPQNLHVYAAAVGNRPLLSTAEQAMAAAGQREAQYRPWRLTKPGRWVRQSLNSNFNLQPDKAFTDGNRPFPSGIWAELVANSNKMAFGTGSGPAITLRHTNLRAMPGSMRYYLRPDLPGEGYPFDYLQLSSVPVGTPLFIGNVSKDGLWLLVESPLSAGWLPAADVAKVDEAFIQGWQSLPLAALVREPLALGEAQGGIGTLLPLAGLSRPGFGQALDVYLPRRDATGKAVLERAALPPDAAVAVPLPLTSGAVARIGNTMMGQAYTWGGLDGKRDCSSLTRDLLAPFGIFLPRNSSAQAGVGRAILLTGMNNEEKEAAIISQAPPFRSLIWLRGHIGLYLGPYQGKAMLFHNMWGLRTRDASGGCDNRAVVGKAVVTTLRPGAERPDLCTRGSFLDRIEKVAVLPQ
jgi:hypothetical protein